MMQVIRDLTLRSAASFGSFHLIRLLYDEYMFYLVEQRLARTFHLSSIAVMAQLADDQLSLADAADVFAQPFPFPNGGQPFAPDTTQTLPL